MTLFTRLTTRYPRLQHVFDHHLKHHVHHIKEHWLTISFIIGFIFDNFTMVSVESVLDNVFLTGHIIVIMSSLLFLYAAAAGKVREKYVWYAKEWLPIVMQFSFGGLMGGLFIFYGRSGAWATSWPFLLVIFGVMIANELVTKRTQRLLINLLMLFVGLFSYLVLIVPVLAGKMGAWIFILSGALSLGIMCGFVFLLRLVVPNFMRANMRMVAFVLGLVYVGFNFLYFTNIIPPIPLSLKELGIYHNVARMENGDYALTYEKGAWYELFKDSDNGTYHYQTGDTLFCFASVFAPTRLSTQIFHRWEYYVPADGEWRTHSRLSYGIDGGRNGGFRGYSWVRNATPGKWRCTVETDRKQVLGSETFDVVDVNVPLVLVTELH